MSRLPVLSYWRVHRLLTDLGFELVRQRGSHVLYSHADGRTTTVPDHGGRDIARPLLREIPREIEVTPEALHRLLRS